MARSRRTFLKLAATASALAAAPPLPWLQRLFAAEATTAAFRPDALPSQEEAWDWLVWMAKLGPKYPGNAAHVQYVDFLASQLEALGLKVARDQYKLPRWDEKRTAIGVRAASGAPFDAPVTSSYPYSGRTAA